MGCRGSCGTRSDSGEIDPASLTSCVVVTADCSSSSRDASARQGATLISPSATSHSVSSQSASLSGRVSIRLRAGSCCGLEGSRPVHATSIGAECGEPECSSPRVPTRMAGKAV
eukprot:scaffold247026_cov30-Tisochrysis_lutea.AAC.1